MFAISCWVLGLIAFSQLLVAGMALATRFEESKVVKTITKEVPKVVVVRIPAVEKEPASPVITRPPVPEVVVTPLALPAPTPVATPKVEDPRSERLLTEARKAKVAGDMDVAILKLQDALLQSPEDPSIHYELGLVHEQMGVFDTAAAHYQKVMAMGQTGAGTLYELAAKKLREGFSQPDDLLGKLSLGRIRLFRDPNEETGQRVILTIPVQKAPGEEVGSDDFGVAVSFFNKTSKGDIIELEDKSWVTNKWSMPIEWAGGEETLQTTYVIPNQDIQTEHLFGARKYYGYVVTLMYKGTVVDMRAWPPALAARMNAQPAGPSGGEQLPPDFQDTPPADFDPGLGVLPPLPK